MNDALGIIETQGFTAADPGSRRAVKAANVKLAKWVKVGGGRVGIIVRGDVAAVKAAVEAGVQGAERSGPCSRKSSSPARRKSSCPNSRSIRCWAEKKSAQ